MDRSCMVCGQELPTGKRKLCGSADCEKDYNAKKQREYRQRKARRNRNGMALQSASKPVKISNPPLRYYGGKWRLADWIIAQFPSRHTTYVEPYCGGASVLFRKPPSVFEVINDLNNNVVVFFDVLRSRPDDLIRAIDLTPFSREEHRRAYRPVPDDCPDSQLEQARRFYIRSRQSFGSGEGKYSTGWRYQARDTRKASLTDEWSNLDALWATAKRLKAVQIENDDAFKVMDRFDTPETLFYVDPPYMFETRYSEEERYAIEMSDNEHIQLSEKLKTLDGMILLSSYPSKLYEELYLADGWKLLQKEARTNGNNKKVECLWISPKLYENQLPLFQLEQSR